MTSVYIDVACVKCALQVEDCEITVESFGCPGTFEEPGEGAEWSFVALVCPNCGHAHEYDEIATRYEEMIQQRIAERESDTEDCS